MCFITMGFYYFFYDFYYFDESFPFHPTAVCNFIHLVVNSQSLTPFFPSHSKSVTILYRPIIVSTLPHLFSSYLPSFSLSISFLLESFKHKPNASFFNSASPFPFTQHSIV